MGSRGTSGVPGVTMLAGATSGSPGGSPGVSLSPAAAGARLIREAVLRDRHLLRQPHGVPWARLQPGPPENCLCHRQCLKCVAVRPLKRHMTNVKRWPLSTWWQVLPLCWTCEGSRSTHFTDAAADHFAQHILRDPSAQLQGPTCRQLLWVHPSCQQLLMAVCPQPWHGCRVVAQPSVTVLSVAPAAKGALLSRQQPL